MHLDIATGIHSATKQNDCHVTCVTAGCVNVKYAKPRAPKSLPSRQIRNHVFPVLFLLVKTPQQTSNRTRLKPTSSSAYKQREVHTVFVTQSSFPTFPTFVIENRFWVSSASVKRKNTRTFVFCLR